jgi:Fur family ferric uptake transcriptional regulator
MQVEQRRHELDETMRRLEANNHQVTEQRRAVVAALMEQRAYVTPRELHAALRLDHPGIGQATVYRTLELLVEVGAAARFPQENNEYRYIYCAPQHHHHLICTRCGLVEDIDGCMVRAVGEALAERTSFEITDHALTFFGYCGACKARR